MNRSRFRRGISVNNLPDNFKFLPFPVRLFFFKKLDPAIKGYVQSLYFQILLLKLSNYRLQFRYVLLNIRVTRLEFRNKLRRLYCEAKRGFNFFIRFH